MAVLGERPELLETIVITREVTVPDLINFEQFLFSPFFLLNLRKFYLNSIEGKVFYYITLAFMLSR